MEQGKGGRGRGAVEELILRMVAAHADSLLRTARRHSMCPDDAQDAYQRTLEIFLANADRLDPARVPGWLHVVVKREAQAICRSRKMLLAASEIDPDSHEARRLPSMEERILSKDLVSRAAEALQRLKPQELRALWLKAEGTLPKLWPGYFRPVFWGFLAVARNPVLPVAWFQGAVPASRSLFNRATLSNPLRRGTFFNPGIFGGG